MMALYLQIMIVVRTDLQEKALFAAVNEAIGMILYPSSTIRIWSITQIALTAM